MAITAADVDYYFSVSAAAGDTTAGTAAGSLGDQISTTVVPNATLHALFDKVTGDESAAGDIEYRCIFIRNNHATLTWENVVVWLSAETAGGATAAISVDTTATSDADSASAQAKTIADENTAPASQTFTAPTTKGTGLSIGNLAPDEVHAIWIRRTVAAATAAANNDGVTIRCEGDTAA